MTHLLLLPDAPIGKQTINRCPGCPPSLPPPQAAYLALCQLLDWRAELVLLLVNTLLSDLKSDNFVVGA